MQLPVNVVFSVGGEIIVNDERDLLDVDTSGQQIGGDEDSRGPGTELSHDHVTFLLVHVSVLKYTTTPTMSSDKYRNGEVLQCLVTNTG